MSEECRDCIRFEDAADRADARADRAEAQERHLTERIHGTGPGGGLVGALERAEREAGALLRNNALVSATGDALRARVDALETVSAAASEALERVAKVLDVDPMALVEDASVAVSGRDAALARAVAAEEARDASRHDLDVSRECLLQMQNAALRLTERVKALEAAARETLDYLGDDQCGPLLASDVPESGVHGIRDGLRAALSGKATPAPPACRHSAQSWRTDEDGTVRCDDCDGEARTP